MAPTRSQDGAHGRAQRQHDRTTRSLDITYFLAHRQDLDVTKASQVPRWRQSEAFTARERDVLEYAEAMTNTPPTVTDELSARLLDQLGPAAMVELTATA